MDGTATGLMRSMDEAACCTAADVFAPFRSAPTDRPFVVAQLGQSLDGRIATLNGDSKYINGDAALDHLHRMRAHVDAVVVGAATIEADDPQLTVRRVQGRNPARVVIDPRGRIGGGGKWLTPDGARHIVVTSAASTPCGAEPIRLAADESGRMAPQDIVAALFRLGLRRILIEGGAHTISCFLDHKCLDRLHILMAPVIIGSGPRGLELMPISSLRDALRPATAVHLLDGGEVLFDCALK